MRMIADIGGTNARFALSGPDGVHGLQILPVADFPDFGTALAVWLATNPAGGGEITTAAIAAAGPLNGESVRLTNAPWTIAAEEVSRALGGAPVRMLNDLEAVALALPELSAQDLEQITDVPLAGGALPMLAVNVGTGFGAAVAIPTPSGWISLATEAGHMSLIPATPSEDTLFRAMRSVEDAFSGPGHARLFGPPRNAGGEQSASIRDDASAEDRRLYSRAFGRLVGDLVLATGAWGGVRFCGGVVHDFDRVFDRDELLRAFRKKGQMAERMERVSVFRITLDSPALISLATLPIP